MKCHYEVLGVAREADDAEIKSAYRKLALRWHPDKNLQNPEEAKEQFQLVQQAYEVLSDLHERAWYDNHREQILRGGNSDYQENCLDLFQYFTVSCFKGYGDDPKGFYHVYSEVFEKIAAEDAEFMDDDEEIESIPKFGNSQSSYEEVVGPFYAYWQSYCTKKSYSWLCPYNISEIRDRRLLREIEKEQKKVVQKAKKERNEEVRNLVSFIRKRDKRVQSYKQLLEERAALNRQKQERIRMEQLKKRKEQIAELKKSKISATNEAYEEQLKQLAQQYGDSEDEYYSDDDIPEEGEENDDLNEEDLAYLDSTYCVACNKQFTNENAFLNHQSSKKHKLNVERIKESFRDEVESVDKQNNSSCTNSEQSDSGEDLITSKKKNKLNKNKNKVQSEEDVDTEELPESESEEEPKALKQKNKKNKKVKKLQQEVEDTVEEIPDLAKLSADEEDWEGDSKSKKKQKGKKGGQKKNTPTQPTPSKESSSNGLTSNLPPTKVPKKPETNGLPPETDIAHTCVTCKATFESKNKLFTHLKKTNHGVYIPKKTATVNAGQPEKTKKGKRNK